MRWIKCAAVAAVAFMGCGGEEAGVQTKAAADERFKQDLAVLQEARIFFGHQSVGKSILDELEAAKGEGMPALNILRLDQADSLPQQAFLAQKFIGSNNRPESKIEDFSLAVTGKPGRLDAAMMKLCYIDFGPDTDSKALFETYRKAVAEIRQANPEVILVHATAPLVTVDKLKTLIKKVMGKKTAEDANMRRHEYNELVHSAFSGEPIFDLAKVESTLPDGRREDFSRGDKTYFSLAGAYTTDGGHLNATGARLAAQEFARVLAEEIRKRRGT